MQTLFKIIYRAFVAMVLVLGLLLLTSLVPVPGNIEVKIVQSGSMEPAIKTGALVLVKPSSTYQVGEVIMFGEDTRTKVPITHRIVANEVRGGIYYYITKGDANEERDPQPVSEKEVIGKVVLDISYLGFILDFAKKPLGFALLIGVPAAMVVFDEVGNIWRETTRIRRKRRTKTDEEGEETT